MTTTAHHASMYSATQEYYRVNKKTLVAALYVRNSDPSKKDSEVLQSQIDALKAYAQEHGYEVQEDLIYADAISALKHPYWERPELMRLWDDAERGKFDIVLCTEFFRLARRSPEQYAIMEYLKRFKVEVISITEKFEDTAEGRLLQAIQGFLGEVEAEKTKIRTLRGKAHRAKQALTGQGSTPIYGYKFVNGEKYKKERYAPNTDPIATVDGEIWTEVRVIEYCFTQLLKGMSTYQIALSLTRMGIPTQRKRVGWNRLTVRQLLKREAYTGVAYNGQWTKDPVTGKFTDKNVVRLPDGIYPKLIEPHIYEQAQRQLALNAELSPRNNQRPKEAILRGVIYCSICESKMYARNYYKKNNGEILVIKSSYQCYINRGVEQELHHHYLECSVERADREAWDFAIQFIKNPTLVRKHIEDMKGKIVKRDHSQDLEKGIAQAKKSIANLYKLAEAADPDDEDGMKVFQERLIALQKDKQEKEKLLAGVSETEDKQEKLLEALDRFEAWAETIRPFLDDPNYVISQEDKIAAIRVLGVRVKIFPTEKTAPNRIECDMFPPDVERYCDGDFGELLSGEVSSRSAVVTLCF